MGAKICRAVGNLVLALSPVRWETEATFAQSVQKAEAYSPNWSLHWVKSGLTTHLLLRSFLVRRDVDLGLERWHEARSLGLNREVYLWWGLAVTTAEVSFRRLLKTSLNWTKKSSMTPDVQPILSGQHRVTWVSLAAVQVITVVPEGSGVQKIDGWVRCGQLDTE